MMEHSHPANDLLSSSSDSLRQLRTEVARIAATLARLSEHPEQYDDAAMELVEPVSDLSQQAVQAVIKARQLRTHFLPQELFAEPAWDMLLDLLHSEIAQTRISVSSLCTAAAVPHTTALRWINSMTESGFLVRRDDPLDGRRVFIELAPSTSESMRRYFQAVGKTIAS